MNFGAKIQRFSIFRRLAVVIQFKRQVTCVGYNVFGNQSTSKVELEKPPFKPIMYDDTLSDGTRKTIKIDLPYPTDWYPVARGMRRTIHLHTGPTNSGKTYSALNALMEAKTGHYLGPLRLLAWEIFDKLNSYEKKKIVCNLMTGQEKEEFEGATHCSSTVEMVDLESKIDVAVIDEIQMIGSPDRGWAWTQAVLGIPAHEIHLCGEGTVVDLIKNMCEKTGDKLILHEYKRLSPLVMQEPLKKMTEFTSGDCIVSFRKKELFKLRDVIENSSSLKCSVLYGTLPPETRRDHAKSFNSGETDVLLTTDAIGMGLNLHIQRVIFTDLKKYDGDCDRHLTISETKQLGGRAGRFKSKFNIGYVTATKKNIYTKLCETMDMEAPKITHCGLLPTLDVLIHLSKEVEKVDLPKMLSLFTNLERNGDSVYEMSDIRKIVIIARLLQGNGFVDKLGLRRSWGFCCAPVDASVPEINDFLLIAAGKMMRKQPIYAGDVILMQPTISSRFRLSVLVNLELTYKLYDLYLWLSNKFGLPYFPDYELVQKAKQECCDNISDSMMANKDRKALHKNKTSQDIKAALFQNKRIHNPKEESFTGLVDSTAQPMTKVSRQEFAQPTSQPGNAASGKNRLYNRKAPPPPFTEMTDVIKDDTDTISPCQDESVLSLTDDRGVNVLASNNENSNSLTYSARVKGERSSPSLSNRGSPPSSKSKMTNVNKNKYVSPAGIHKAIRAVYRETKGQKNGKKQGAQKRSKSMKHIIAKQSNTSNDNSSDNDKSNKSDENNNNNDINYDYDQGETKIETSIREFLKVTEEQK